MKNPFACALWASWLAGWLLTSPWDLMCVLCSSRERERKRDAISRKLIYAAALVIYLFGEQLREHTLVGNAALGCALIYNPPRWCICVNQSSPLARVYVWFILRRSQQPRHSHQNTRQNPSLLRRRWTHFEINNNTPRATLTNGFSVVNNNSRLNSIGSCLLFFVLQNFVP